MSTGRAARHAEGILRPPGDLPPLDLEQARLRDAARARRKARAKAAAASRRRGRR